MSSRGACMYWIVLFSCEFYLLWNWTHRKSVIFLQRANDLAYRIGPLQKNYFFYEFNFIRGLHLMIYYNLSTISELLWDMCCRLKKTSNISIKLKFCLHVALDRRTNVLLSMSFVSFTSYEIEPTNTGCSENTVKCLGSIP